MVIKFQLEHRRSDAGRIVMQTPKPSDVDRIVAKIDETRVAEHFRNQDRPDSRFVKTRRLQDPAIGRAKTRLRTAAYRNRLDQRGAPATQQIAMALLVGLVTSRLDELTEDDRGIVGRMLTDLQGRGFSISESQAMLRRLRDRIVDPSDRECGSTESTS
jgi:hypothetical protein